MSLRKAKGSVVSRTAGEVGRFMSQNKYLLFVCLYLLISLTIAAQVKYNPTPLKINHRTGELKIKLHEETDFTFQLKKDVYYSIIVEQKGIDLVIELKDKSGKRLVSQDSPIGNFGAERFDFSAAEETSFTLSVKPLDKPKNPQEGLYSVLIREVTK